MNNSKKIKKQLIDNFDELLMFKKMMSEKSFFEKYDVSMSLVEGIACAKGLVYIESTDRAMNDKEKELLLSGNF